MCFPFLHTMVKSPGMRMTEMKILPPLTVTASANGPVSVYAVDVDGNGDIDVLFASHDDDNGTNSGSAYV